MENSLRSFSADDMMLARHLDIFCVPADKPDFPMDACFTLPTTLLRCHARLSPSGHCQRALPCGRWEAGREAEPLIILYVARLPRPAGVLASPQGGAT
jgi:hypothetical protein